MNLLNFSSFVEAFSMKVHHKSNKPQSSINYPSTASGNSKLTKIPKCKCKIFLQITLSLFVVIGLFNYFHLALFFFHVWVQVNYLFRSQPHPNIGFNPTATPFCSLKNRTTQILMFKVISTPSTNLEYFFLFPKDESDSETHVYCHSRVQVFKPFSVYPVTTITLTKFTGSIYLN
jgi:hypothetical protein